MPGQCLNFRRLVLLPKLGILVLTLSLPAAQVRTAHAGSPALAKTKLIWPSFGIAFPTGRFAEIDPKTSKAGHKTGFDGGLDIGYAVGEYVVLGAAIDYARFDMDFGADTTVRIYELSSARTAAISGHIWIRAFFPGGYAHWRPYALFGLGIGRPKAKIVSPGHPSVARFEYTVNTSVSLTGGIGVLIPVSELLSLVVEPRYRLISTKGAGMTELRVYHDGSSQTFLNDQSGNRLRQKSNTTWWELRAGLTVMIR